MPVIGFVNAGSREERRDELQGFVRGVGEIGYVEGQSVAIEYRWAQGRIDRLPAMVAELVDRKVSVIAATTTPAALAAQAATTTIPIVFETGSNLIQLGLVVSLNRPGGNLTGVTSLIVEVAPKRLELLHELLPTAKVMGLLVNPADRNLAQTQCGQNSLCAKNGRAKRWIGYASTRSRRSTSTPRASRARTARKDRCGWLGRRIRCDR